VISKLMASGIILFLSASIVQAKTYIVQKNDSIWRIAKKQYQLTKNAEIYKAWKAIARENGLTNPSLIRAGQKLIIPKLNSNKKMKAPKGYVYAFTRLTKLTAYDRCRLCCGSHANGKTSIGDNARILNGVAADPRAIAYRSKVYIPGIGFKEIDDTGSEMCRAWRRGIYHLDIRFSNHRQAKAYGKKWRDVIYFKKIKNAPVRMASK